MRDSVPVESFTGAVVRVIKRIPKGRVATYGQVAMLAGNPRGARQVVRVLNTRSRIDRLPWHRIINRLGRVALPQGDGFELQRELLRREGVYSDPAGNIDLSKFLWKPKAR